MKAKIGNKIRGVLEKYPEVRERRAQLNAVGYLFRHKHNTEIQWSTAHSQTDTCLILWTCHPEKGYREHMDIFHMKPLSEYLYEPPITQIVDGDTIVGPLPPTPSNVKLIFKDGKFIVAPSNPYENSNTDTQHPKQKRQGLPS
jgi:hypothetical protein